jgi:hypothetical protein
MRIFCVMVGIVILINPIMGQINFRVSTDKSIYDYNETIFVRITAYNPTSTPETLWFSSGCQAGYYIDTLDYMHHDSITIFCGEAFTSRTIPSNDSVMWSDWLYNFTGAMIGPGTHAVTAWVAYLPTGWFSDTLWINIKNPTMVDDNMSTSDICFLDEVYPNPFNPTTTIKFNLLHPSSVTLKIFTLLGQEVTTLIHGDLPIGMHYIRWDAKSFSSGIYVCRLQSGRYIETAKLFLIK